MAFLKPIWVILIFGFTSVYVVFNVNRWRTNYVLTWDIAGYYLYLPAVFVYKDLKHAAYYGHIDSLYAPSQAKRNYSLYDVEETGNKVNKYTMGTAIFELPFFLIAHTYCEVTRKFPADGYSPPYRLVVCIATVFWVLMGLFVLKKVLAIFFTETVTAISLLLLAFGTNIYCYTAFEWGMSHSFLFFLFAAFLYCTTRWSMSHSRKYLLCLGAILGWIVITRPSDITVALIFVLWPGAITKTFKSEMPAFLLAGMIFLLVISPQLIYWKFITGHWFYYTYRDERFHFLSPAIWKGLFSYRKGWLIYTPMALVALAGIPILLKKYSKLAAPVCVFLAINVYVVFSWQAWSYGGGFGARALIEGLAILSIPLAAFAEWLMAYNNRKARVLIITILAGLVILNLFQTYQYSHGVIMPDEMDRSHYWSRFFDLDVKAN